MSTLSQSLLRIITFGSASTVWGVVWHGPDRRLLLGGASGEAVLDEFAIDGDGERDDWQLFGDGVSLAVTPVGSAATEVQLGGFDQLCHVRGDVEHRSVDELGRRCTRKGISAERFGSVRDFSAWFEPAEEGAPAQLPAEESGVRADQSAGAPEGAALTALRPLGARGHDTDLIGAARLRAGVATIADEPRLSTGYTADGIPDRAALELWIAQPDDEDNLYPWRVAGEASAPPVKASAGTFELQARPLRSVAEGRPGSGIYLLAQCP